MKVITIVTSRYRREMRTDDGDLVIALRGRLSPGEWLVTAHDANLIAPQVQGFVRFNESGFRGRQWESDIDGQQHPTLKSAMEQALREARGDAVIAQYIKDHPVAVA